MPLLSQFLCGILTKYHIELATLVIYGAAMLDCWDVDVEGDARPEFYLVGELKVCEGRQSLKRAVSA